MTHDPNLDVTGKVSFADCLGVAKAANDILGPRFGNQWDRSILTTAFQDLSRAFRGEWPGYLAADTPYHDLRHSLDAALAMARLVEGHERSCDEGSASRPLGARLSMLGVVLSLFHDVGFLRRSDEAHLGGASLCHDHENRSVEFVRAYLREGPFADIADTAELLLATKLDWRPDGPDSAEREMLAALLGTADLICQIADPHYLERCWEHLFDEFAVAGLAGRPDSPYPDRKTLLLKTTDFLRGLALPRLEVELRDCQRYLPVFFGGSDPYLKGLTRNLDRLDRMIASGSFDLLGPSPSPLYFA